MNFDSTNLFELASKRLGWLSARQKVVAENVANSDVSGYRAKDVESFAGYLSRSAAINETSDAEVIEVEDSWGQDLSGNNVVLEEQMVLAAGTAGQYRLATGLYRKAQQMILTVASGR